MYHRGKFKKSKRNFKETELEGGVLVASFGSNLIEIRKGKGLTQKALAEMLEITPTRLNYWEKDKRFPDLDMIRKLAEAL